MKNNMFSPTFVKRLFNQPAKGIFDWVRLGRLCRPEIVIGSNTSLFAMLSSLMVHPQKP